MGQARRADGDGNAASRPAIGGAVKGLFVMGVKTAVISGRRDFANLIESFRDNEDGATAIEYSLLVALIFLAIVTAVRAFTSTTSEMYENIDDTLQNG